MSGSVERSPSIPGGLDIVASGPDATASARKRARSSGNPVGTVATETDDLRVKVRPFRAAQRSPPPNRRSVRPQRSDRRLAAWLVAVRSTQGIKPMLPPACLMEELPSSEALGEQINLWRAQIADVMRGKDDRLICVVGPCSVHDPQAAMEYAKRLKDLSDEISKDILIVMRVYFEKPRTTVGWKGLINDPDLDGTFKINKGLRIARQLLLDINELGLPAGTEFLDTMSPQFTADLVAWGAIGARTTESQIHRELTSGLSMPVGFKNGTSGDCQVAVDACRAAAGQHSFLSVSKQGVAGIVQTSGNEDCHLILRGGANGPNYKEEDVQAACAVLAKGKLHQSLIVDCSHGNSKKIHTNQPIVAADLAKRIAAGDKKVAGVMLESFLKPGNQKIPTVAAPAETGGAKRAKRSADACAAPALKEMEYGMSVTDACMDWEMTVDVVQELAKAVRDRRQAGLAPEGEASPAAAGSTKRKAVDTLQNGSSFTGKGVDDLRIKKIQPLVSAACLLEELPCDTDVTRTVVQARKEVQAVMDGRDDRLLVVVGPCSVHDPQAAMEYARMLMEEKEKHAQELLIVMRVYFEKPRTTVGWKGLINDPDLDGTFKINKGLRIARQLLLDINELGLPAGTEFLDTMSPQFTADLVAWGAIGARTTESQIHRELTSGLSMPVGFKNGTSGDCQVAVDACRAAAGQHSFLSVSKQGVAGIVQTSGNEDCHLILRGGANGPNYKEEDVQAACAVLAKGKLHQSLIVDCSHGNSKKIHTNQPIVAADLAKRIAAGDKKVAGVMLESFLKPGRQDIPKTAAPAETGGAKRAKREVEPKSPRFGGLLGAPVLKDMAYGMSVTDACMDWDMTKATLDELAAAIKARRALASA